MTATTIWISIVGFCFALLNFILFISLGKTKKEAEELFKAKVENLIDKFNKELSNQLKAAQENTDKLNKEINDMHLIYIGEIQNRKQSTISLNNELRKIMSSKIPIEALTQAYDEVFEKEEKQNIIRHHIQDLKYSNDKVIKERAIYSITQYAPDSIGISEGIKILEEFFRTSSEDEELRRKAADSIKRLEEMKLSKV